MESWTGTVPVAVHDGHPETLQQVVVGSRQSRRQFRHQNIATDRQRHAAKREQEEAPIVMRRDAALEDAPGCENQQETGCDKDQLRPDGQAVARVARRVQSRLNLV